jgi:peptide deformylase
MKPQLQFYPESEVLISHANPVLRFGTELEEIVKEMRVVMRDAEGVGLAAPQVGLGIRMFVTDKHVYVNPQILDVSDKTNVLEEGCLSLPGLYADVRRHNNVTIKYQDTLGFWHQEKIEGFRDARIVQHEYDHLDGFLFAFYSVPRAVFKPLVVRSHDFHKLNLLEVQDI